MNDLSIRLKRNGTAAALLALFLLAAYLLARNTGLNPRVFADEWHYSNFARLTPLRDAQLPSYLYFGLFRLSSTCGAGFLECARLLNLAAFIGSAPFIYLVARQVCAARPALLVTALSLLAPVNGYTAYFMPEATYFFCFWLFAWSVLRFHKDSNWRTLVASGAILGLGAMVKMHALFLLPSYCAFIAYAAWVHRAKAGRLDWIATALYWIVAAVTTAAAVRMGIGYLIAGKSGLSLIGTLYGSQAAHSDASHPSLAMLAHAVNNLRGHVLALSLLFSVPLASLGMHFLNAPASAQIPTESRYIAVFTTLMLLALLVVTALFTASVVGQNASETDARLHLRYYDFLFPLLLIWCASQLRSASPARKKWPLALPMAALMVYAWRVLTRYYIPSLVDCPEFDGLAYRPDIFAALSTLSLLVLLAWWRDSRLGMRLFLFVFMPVYTVTATLHLNKEFRRLLVADVYVQAGQLAHLYLQPADQERLTIVAPDGAGLYKTRFFVDNRASDILMLPEGSTVRLVDLDKKTRWLMLIGDYKISSLTASRVEQRGYSLLQILPGKDSLRSIDFSVPGYDGYLNKASGLSAPESFGSWSTGKEVRLALTTALPEQAQLDFTATAFGPNADEDFIVTVGAQSQHVRFSGSEQKVTLRFDTDGKEMAIAIQVPHPISPAALGQGSDNRALGFALSRLTITQAGKSEAAAP